LPSKAILAVGAEGRLMLLKRAHLRYRLRVPRDARDRGWPAHPSLQHGFAVTWETDLLGEGG
jgi:hypothetical protein